jgi:hypothetical protein
MSKSEARSLENGEYNRWVPEDQRPELTHVYSRNLMIQTCQDHARARAISRTKLSYPQEKSGWLELVLR